MAGPLWIGVDGGATSVRAVTFEDGPTGRLRSAGRRARQDWITPTAFEPPVLESQLGDLDANGHLDASRLHPDEALEGTARLHTLANLIAELTFGVQVTEVHVGICLPGRVDPSGRSIVACLNGPRLPDALDRWALELEGRNLTLAQPVDRIHSDGEAAGWGEDLAEGGAFTDVRCALYLGVGTGVAEAAKSRGVHLDVAGLRELGPAPWEAPSAFGDQVDAAAGLRGMQARWRKECGPGLRLLDAVRREDPRAIAILMDGARALADHAATRVEALGSRGEPVERIVLGQRASELWTAPEFAPIYRRAFEQRFVQATEVVASRLLEAPALGALGATLGRVAALRAGS